MHTLILFADMEEDHLPGFRSEKNGSCAVGGASIIPLILTEASNFYTLVAYFNYFRMALKSSQ